MPFQVFEQGRRIETPWYALFPEKQVNPVQRVARIRRLSAHGDTEPVEESSESGVSVELGGSKPSSDRLYLPRSRQYQSALASYDQSSGDSHAAHAKPLQLASQVMSVDLFTLTAGASVDEAWSVLRQHRIRHLPVVSSQGGLEGLVSDRDLLLALSGLEPKKNASLHTRLESIMRKRVLTATADTPLRELTMVMLERHIGCMPIVEWQGQLELRGMVTRSDLLKAISHQVPLELWA